MKTASALHVSGSFYFTLFYLIFSPRISACGIFLMTSFSRSDALIPFLQIQRHLSGAIIFPSTSCEVLGEAFLFSIWHLNSPAHNTYGCPLHMLRQRGAACGRKRERSGCSGWSPGAGCRPEGSDLGGLHRVGPLGASLTLRLQRIQLALMFYWARISTVY